MATLWAVIGALAALALGAALAAAGPEHERRGWSLGLLVAALIYVGFGVVVDFVPDWLHLELAGLLAFGGLALAGWRYPMVLAAGWLLHVLWDGPVHASLTATHVPAFYPPLCLGFDVVAAMVVVWRLGIRPRRQAQPA